MKIIHSFKKQRILKEVNQDLGFLLTTEKGSYLSLTTKPISRYQGWFVPFENNLFKIIENIEPVGLPSVKLIRNNFWSVDRKRGQLEESFFLPNNYNSLVYELSKKAEIEISLDIKESYDNSDFGRFYQISVEKDSIVIKYTQAEIGCFYLALKSDLLKFEKIDQWLKRDYQLDTKRNSPPASRFVYRALRLTGQKFVFCVSQDKQEALREVRRVFNNIIILKNLEKERVEKRLKLVKIKDRKIKMAYLCAKNSLASLTVFQNYHLGIYAGLPWFFQFWSRDESLCLKALDSILPHQAKDILLRLIVSLRADGRLLALPAESSDSVGLMFKRVADFIDQKRFSKSQIDYISLCLKKSIEALLEHHTEDDLALSQPQQTWMDTLDRSGPRIEIQAGRLLMYQLAFRLTGQTKYQKLEKKLKKAVGQKMWQDQMLADGLADFKLRPNLFLAAYLYPKLLTKKQWGSCFEKALAALWLNWGGLASLDKNDPLFCSHHTGQDPQSYHNGDSWFYLNNLAALVLLKTDPKKFKQAVAQILKASSREILWLGLVGHHAELSSASQFQSEGCWAQAWSAAMYIELIEEFSK